MTTSCSTFEEFKKGVSPCDGCADKKPGDICAQKKCAKKKNFDKCVNCAEYPCKDATAGYDGGIRADKPISAADVTWAILPYVPERVE